MFEFDALQARMSAKAALGQGRCAACGQFFTKPPVKAPESAVFYKDRDRAAKMVAEDRKRFDEMQHRQDLAALRKFANTPARPSKSDVKNVLDSFDEVLKPKKTTTDVESLFGTSPEIPKEKLV